MADSNHFKSPDNSGFHDNDPFAELMRLAERSPAPAGASTPAPDDFGIDLEKEMLGDFDFDDAPDEIAPEPTRPVESQWQPTETHDAAPQIDQQDDDFGLGAELETAFTDVDHSPEQWKQPEPVDGPAVEPTVERQDDDFGLGAELETAFSDMDVQPEPTWQPEAYTPEPEAEQPEHDFGIDAELETAFSDLNVAPEPSWQPESSDHRAVDPVAVDAPVEADDDYELDLSSELDDAFGDLVPADESANHDAEPIGYDGETIDRPMHDDAPGESYDDEPVAEFVDRPIADDVARGEPQFGDAEPLPVWGAAGWHTAQGSDELHEVAASDDDGIRHSDSDVEEADAEASFSVPHVEVSEAAVEFSDNASDHPGEQQELEAEFDEALAGLALDEEPVDDGDDFGAAFDAAWANEAAPATAVPEVDVQQSVETPVSDESDDFDLGGFEAELAAFDEPDAVTEPLVAAEPELPAELEDRLASYYDDAPNSDPEPAIVSEPSFEDELSMFLGIEEHDEVDEESPVGLAPEPEPEPIRAAEPHQPEVLLDETGSFAEHSETPVAASPTEILDEDNLESDDFAIDDFDLDLNEIEPAPEDDDTTEALVEEPVQPSRSSSPFAMFAALAPAMSRFGGGAKAQSVPVPESDGFRRPARSNDVPDIETVEVEDQAVALADDLDLPDLPQAHEPDPAPVFSPDDLEAELDEAFGSLAPDDNYSQPIAAGGMAAGIARHTAAASVPPSASDVATPVADLSPDMHGYDATASSSDQGDIDFEYDLDEDIEGAPRQPRQRGAVSPWRKFIVAGSVAAVALLAGIGYFAGGGAGTSGTPAIVRADAEPVKVRPENRGGATVPNQDSQAYQRAAGLPADPNLAQEQLISAVEEPIDVSSAIAQPPRLSDLRAAASAPATDAVPTVEEGAAQMIASIKSEDRVVMQDAGQDEMIVAPRRVRTMVVRPDGTLIASDAAVTPVAADGQETLTEIAAVAGGGQLAVTPRVEDALQLDQAATGTVGEVLPGDPVMPETVSVVPSRPGARPSATQPAAQLQQQVAAVNPAAPAAAPTTAASSEWSMQIASQPTAEAAQTAYQDLAQRYGNVLQGKGVNIIRADIDGMGTFYRVRIPASTRDEAVQLCTQFKSAGGNCFVSR